ncbi:spore coat U domain-containing protein [Neorhizobium galegae]|uniref:Spore coat U domain-containing protein n=1 Tax=Neorhizobium galegae TaxID=399 RepID=A0A6A1THP3_NEOGA|nr:spore coat U domain-containing protein [Neorhizobium galegae]KAB1082377.1 spore coat U domain-containing protein [Neorhizobium galegae]
MRKASLHFLSALAGLLFASVAGAQTATTTFNVQMTINGQCVINSASNIDFGANGVINTNVDATGTIIVQCTSGTAYNIGLNAGTGTGATVAQRRMTGPGAAVINYSLFRDSGHLTLWGNTIGTDTQTGSGNGAAQSLTVYGRVAPQTTPAPGSYADTVTVTLTY